MLAVIAALAVAASSTCPPSDARADLLALHESARQAHLQGDAAPLAAAVGDRLLLAEDGVLRTQTKAEVERFFTAYLKRIRYREWRDVSPPVVAVSPDGQMAWMAIALEAKYTSADKPAEGEKSFKSSWIATYQRIGCDWRMTAIASDVVN